MCIHLYIAAGIYALYVRSMGWFWRVTVGGGGDRTQWFCVCPCVCDLHACICVYVCGAIAAPRERSLPPPESVFSSEESVGNCLRNYSHTPLRAYSPSISPLLPIPPPRPHAHYIIINIGLNLLFTHTYIKMSYLRLLVLFTALPIYARNEYIIIVCVCVYTFYLL